MSDLGQDQLPWPQTMDAKIWADEFCKRNTASDHGTMLGWFANAIMIGYDTAERRFRKDEASEYCAQQAAEVAADVKNDQPLAGVQVKTYPAENLRERVLAEINTERDRQEVKWGRQDHQPERWLSILGEEFGEVCKAICEASFPGYPTTGYWSQYRKELIHVAAVAAAMAECFDRGRAVEPTYSTEVAQEDSGYWYAWDSHPEQVAKCLHGRTWNINRPPYFMKCLTCGAKKREATRQEVLDAHNKKAVAEAREIGRVGTFRFEEGNEVLYGQDFDVYQGVPPGIDFEVTWFTSTSFRLCAPGYGKKNDYGNGCLYVYPRKDKDLFSRLKEVARPKEP